jgi:hypothetical protein
MLTNAAEEGNKHKKLFHVYKQHHHRKNNLHEKKMAVGFLYLMASSGAGIYLISVTCPWRTCFLNAAPLLNFAMYI